MAVETTIFQIIAPIPGSVTSCPTVCYAHVPAM